jgi:Fibronectin type III domain
VTVQVTGRVGVPSDAAGAALYIGAANASANGYVMAFPAGGPQSGLRVLSYEPQHIERNFVYEPLSSSGQITLVNNGSAPVDLMAAVQGYFVSPSGSEAGGTFSDVTPTRIADTRSGNGGVPATPVPARGSITFTATGVAGIPSNAVPAVVESVAAANPTANGYLSVYPAGGTDPQNSVVNFNAGDGQVNDLTAPLVSAVSPTGRKTITNHSSGTVDVIVAARGYYTAATAPDSDVQTDAGVQNGTATVTWMAPITAGGAATSYKLTLYNPDGSVAQTASYGPSTYGATLTGLTASGTYSVGVAAVNAVGTGGIATTPVQDSTGSVVQGTTEIASQGLDMSVDPTNDTISLDSVISGTDTTYDSSGNVLSTLAISPDTSTLWTSITPDASANPSCYKKTVQNSNVIALRTFHNDHQGNSYTVSWLNQIYEVKNARVKHNPDGSAYETRQYQYCVTGGGNVHNKYHQWFDGHALTINQKGDREIDRRWGTGVAPGTATITTALNFALNVGKATIGASVTVHPRSGPGGGDFKGDVGADGRFLHYPGAWKDFWKNRINTFYVAPHNYVWDGTGDYEGNTSHGLYEFRMSYSGKVHFLGAWTIKAFCSDDNLGCPPFNWTQR